ncbi:hypothetical protein KQX54_006960 [Cotesia glomerata]|uniref:Uncharacterized protein n=1 Tax=Cotesia glomerata TaxID=32391 RepID=A0AAV7I5X1_COTGL|nr:hypothetical protein KQX54_006960 [Cotesia glomerata]
MWDIIGGVGVTRRSTPGRCNPAKALADKLADNSELEILLAHLVPRLHATEFSTFFKILLARLELQKEEKLRAGSESGTFLLEKGLDVSVWFVGTKTKRCREIEIALTNCPGGAGCLEIFTPIERV